jgi:hypothetical protein
VIRSDQFWLAEQKVILAKSSVFLYPLLRDRTATARGFGDDIKLPVLAKLMLAERFIPRLFEQIAFVAAIHSDGHCKDLEALETFLTISNKNDDKPKEKKPQKYYCHLIVRF